MARESANLPPGPSHIHGPDRQIRPEPLKKSRDGSGNRHVQAFGRTPRTLEMSRRLQTSARLRSSNLLGQSAAPAEQDASRNGLKQAPAPAKRSDPPARGKCCRARCPCPERAAIGCRAPILPSEICRLLGVRRGLFIDDDQVGGKLFHAPVFVRAQQLADDFEIFRLIDAHQHDGQIAGNSMGPQGGALQCTAAEDIGGRAQRSVGVKHGICEPLE